MRMNASHAHYKKADYFCQKYANKLYHSRSQSRTVYASLSKSRKTYNRYDDGDELFVCARNILEKEISIIT